MMHSAMFVNARAHGRARRFSFDDLHADPEDLFARETAGAVERALEAARRLNRQLQRTVEFIARGQLFQKIAIEQRIERCRRACHVVGETGRRTRNRRHEIEKMRIREKERKELNAARQTRQDAVELREGDIGIGRRRKRIEKRRHEFGEEFACARAARGPDAAVMPAANGAATWLGSLKPMLASVSTVSGSSSTPVKTRLPLAVESGASRSNSRA